MKEDFEFLEKIENELNFEVGKKLPDGYTLALGMNAIGNCNYVTEVSRSKHLLVIECLLGISYEIFIDEFEIIRRILVVITNKKLFDYYLYNRFKRLYENEDFKKNFYVTKFYVRRMIPFEKFREYEKIQKNIIKNV